MRTLEQRIAFVCESACAHHRHIGPLSEACLEDSYCQDYDDTVEPTWRGRDGNLRRFWVRSSYTSYYQLLVKNTDSFPDLYPPL